MQKAAAGISPPARRWKKYNVTAWILRHPPLRPAPIAQQIAEVIAR